MYGVCCIFVTVLVIAVCTTLDAVFYSRSENYHLLRLQLRVSSLLLAVCGAIEICDTNGILGFL